MEFKNVQRMSLEEKKAYLQELIAERDRIASGEILRKQSGGLEAAAEALMPYDPMSAFNIMDKKTKTDIDRQEMLMKANKAQYDPDQIRFKLSSRLNAISAQMSQLNAADPEYKELKAEATRIKAEIVKDNPTIQGAILGGEVIQPPPPGASATYESIQADINGATKETFESIKSNVATNKSVAKLSDEQSKYIDTLLEQKRRELFPVAKKRPKSSVSETVKYLNGYLADVVKWAEASKLNPDVDSDRLLLAKIKSRDYANEAYMSDDATLSSGFVMQAINKLTGVSALPKADAIAFKSQIPNKYQEAVNGAKIYLGDKYFNDLSQATIDNASNILKTKILAGTKNTTGGLKLGGDKSKETKSNPLGLNLD